MRSSGVLAAALLGFLGAAHASATGSLNRWESIGPFPYVDIPSGSGADWALAIAVVPDDPQTIYAGYNAGVYKTSDGGSTWMVVFTDNVGGVPPNTRPVQGLSIDRGDPSTVFAVTTDSIQRTRNAGLTWHPGLMSPQVAASTVWQVRPLLDLMLEHVVAFEDAVTGPGTSARTRQYTLAPGIRFGWNFGDRQLVFGTAAPVTFAQGGHQTAWLLYGSYELPFRR